ncbi:unnamed protein product [Schistocephalus solidus]|uniref:DUF3523 domain-containing protein n=1 Tax=Schistocephalus solidus TaxID=70667 RepID=A0A183SXN0_SCHSO|nr:unnamed protein product [Schistocephalus solidus]
MDRVVRLSFLLALIYLSPSSAAYYPRGRSCSRLISSDLSVTDHWRSFVISAPMAAVIVYEVLREAHEDQKRELKQIQERENKEMKAQQTKISIESNRTVLGDRKLKNKAERDRRIRELNDYNTKRFIDQRKAQAQRNERQIQELCRRHDEEEQGVVTGVNRERDELIHSYQEELLASKRTTVI